MRQIKKMIFLLFIIIIISGCGSKTKNLIGTWKLISSNPIITLENGEEIILSPELDINEENLSEDGTCGGSGCKSFIYSTEFENIQVYVGNLCYELIDKETLKQIKCYSDNIAGFDQKEDETEHDIIYKKEVNSLVKH